MDLDELKVKLKKLSASTTQERGPAVRSLDGLIASLQAQDREDAKTLRRMKTFFALAALIYGGIFTLTWIAPPDDAPGLHRAILGLFALVFVSIAVFSWKKSRELSGVNYAEPVRTFVASVEKRYRFIRLKEVIFIVAYVLILSITCTAALITAFERYFPSVESEVVLLACCIVFPVLWTASFLLGWRVWKRTKEPLLKEIRLMQTTLQEGAPD